MGSSFDSNGNKFESKEINNREFDNVARAKRGILVDGNGDNIDNTNPLEVLQALNDLVLQKSITVTTSATQVPGTNLTDRRNITFINNADQVMYLGDASVTISDGLPMGIGQNISVDASDTVDFFAIVETGTGDMRVLEGK